MYGFIAAKIMYFTRKLFYTIIHEERKLPANEVSEEGYKEVEEFY